MGSRCIAVSLQVNLLSQFVRTKIKKPYVLYFGRVIPITMYLLSFLEIYQKVNND